MFVTTDLDTLLTALYVLIDNPVIPSGQRRPGHPKKLLDAELVCPAVAQVLLGARVERPPGGGCATRGWATCSPTWPSGPAIPQQVEIRRHAALICQATQW